MVNGNQALVEGAYEAFGRGDIPAVLGILSDDVEWDVPDVLPQGRHAHGPEQVAGFFEGLGAAWSDFGLDIEGVVASGDRVCVIGKAKGTHDGRQTGYEWVHSWTVRDGAAVRFHEYVDPEANLNS